MSLNTEMIIQRFVNKWNDLYDYSMVNYINSMTKVIIICFIHGEYKQLPANHLKYGCGKCGKCNNKLNNILKEKAANSFKDKASSVHAEKYTYDKSIYINVQTKTIVTCPNHGDFSVTPNNHLKGKGCKKCGNIKSAESKVIPFEKYLEFFIDKHGHLYDYSQVQWIDIYTHINVICKIHGVFEINPYKHKTGSGCSKCSAQYSKASIKWLNYLVDKYGYDIQHAENRGEFIIPSTRYKADGYCEKTNTIFEYVGDFWHGNPKIYNKDDINPRIGVSFGELYEKTIARKNIIINLGYNYIEIWEQDWKILENEINTND